MKNRSCLWALLVIGLFLGMAALEAEAESSNTGKGLRAFASEEELEAWAQKKKASLQQHPLYAPALEQSEKMAESPAADSEASVTNTQTEGVDEGGIVKRHGKHLVILRRGRLFTVLVGDGALRPVDMCDAFPSGAGRNAWYDEVLIAGDTIVIIGYSYASGGTEIHLFNIDDAGQLTYRSTYVLRSNDYFSSRNYASRLIGNTLIFYTPLYFNFHIPVMDNLPAMWRWQRGNAPDFKRLAPASRIYRTDDDLDSEWIALHTVTSCDIADGKLECSASAVLGPAGREFYVARNAVYVWTAPFEYGRRGTNRQPVAASVFRLPLDEQQPPAALKALGHPVDQFSFLESADSHLNILLRAEGPTPSMWSSERGSRNLALLRVPLDAFGDGTEYAPNEAYHPLPASIEASIQNRYIGDYLVYGVGQTWIRGRGALPSENSIRILDWKHPETVTKVTLPHSVDRIEALGKAPLLVGTKGKDLYFSAVAIQQEDLLGARLADSFRLKDASQGETRSHGFFYKPDMQAKDGESGLLGLPFVSAASDGRRQLRAPSSGVVFLRNEHLRFMQMGTLNASVHVDLNDRCKVSCVDWYGNSRPLFVDGRVFALMGYEIVEGGIADGHIMEIRRIDILRGQKTQKR